MKKCPNCGKTRKMDRFIDVPVSYIIKYNNYLRIQNTYKQLKMEREDIVSFVKPLFVLEHNEIDVNFKKKEFTKLKIGVNSNITQLHRSNHSDVPTAFKRQNYRFNIEDFKNIKNNRHFLDSYISVCEECYFLLNDINILTNSDMNAKLKQTELHNQVVSIS